MDTTTPQIQEAEERLQTLIAKREWMNGEGRIELEQAIEDLERKLQGLRQVGFSIYSDEWDTAGE